MDGCSDEGFVVVLNEILGLPFSSSSSSRGTLVPPIASRRRKTAFSSSDIPFGALPNIDTPVSCLGSSGSSDSFDDDDLLSKLISSTSFLLLLLAIIGGGLLDGRPNIESSSSLSKSL